MGKKVDSIQDPILEGETQTVSAYYDGDAQYIKLGLEFRVMCCDCYLMHRHKITMAADGKTLIMRSWRDDRSTAQLRRHRGNPIKKTRS